MANDLKNFKMDLHIQEREADILDEKTGKTNHVNFLVYFVEIQNVVTGEMIEVNLKPTSDRAKAYLNDFVHSRFYSK